MANISISDCSKEAVYFYSWLQMILVSADFLNLASSGIED